MMTSRNFFIGILNTITAMFSKGNHTSSIGSEFGLAMNYDEMPTSFHEKKLYKGYFKKKKPSIPPPATSPKFMMDTGDVADCPSLVSRL